jgi:hypothetical protein
MLITKARTLKSASALAEGDRIEGTSKYDKGESVIWTIADVQNKIHPVLGAVVQVNVHTRDEGGWISEGVEFFLRPTERIWIEN